MSSRSGREPTRDAVKRSVAEALGALPSESELFRKTRKAIVALDSSHEAFCTKLEERADKRVANLEASRRIRTAEAEQLLADVRASARQSTLSADPALKSLAETDLLAAESALTTIAGAFDNMAALDAEVDRIEREFRTWGDKIVLAAVESTYKEDGLERFAAALSYGVKLAIIAAAFKAPLAIPAAIVEAVALTRDLAAKLSKKGKLAAKDAAIAQSEAAIELVGAANQIMQTWRAAI